MTTLPHRKFVFETVFDADGAVYQPAKPQRAFSIEEMEEARRAAFAEGQGSALARSEAEAAAALSQIANLTRAALGALAEVAHGHREASAGLAMAAARKIADAALDRFPEDPALSALETLAREIEAAPRLVVHVAPEQLERMTKALEDAALNAGFPGKVTVKPDLSRSRAAFVFDWGDGRAAFDPDAAAARVAAALTTALAAEGLHAEVPLPVIPEV